MGVRRSYPLSLSAPLGSEVTSLLAAFRLIVNLAVREALDKNLTARGSLVPFAQRVAREEHLNFHHARRATELALSLDRGHRRRIRKGVHTTAPYLRRPFLVATAKTFHLDPASGKVRLSLRFGEWSSFSLRLGDYHRRLLADSGVAVKELVVRPTSVTLIVEKAAPEPYVPIALLALDTNEGSLDGVRLTAARTVPVTVPFPEVLVLQQRHFERRRRLGRKKAHDRRVGRRLLSREGRRERHRIVQRLHRLTSALLAIAAADHAALAVERLENLPLPRRRRRAIRRRLSSWPRREIHRQLFYKAEERGVPVVLVNPRYSSRTCLRCGEIQERRSRVGTRFECGRCGWALDRQLNAGANLARTVLAETRELGGLRVDLDALLHDAVMPLCTPETIRGARAERTGREADDPYPK